MYSSIVLEHFRAPYHRGRCAGSHLAGQSGEPGAGPYMMMSLVIHEEVVVEAWFETYNCPSAIACGSWLARWLEGKTCQFAAVVDACDIDRMVGGLPPGKEHCPELAVRCLRDALKQWNDSLGGIPA